MGNFGEKIMCNLKRTLGDFRVKLEECWTLTAEKEEILKKVNFFILKANFFNYYNFLITVAIYIEC